MLVDYAFPPHPSAAALRAAGATGVSRYLSYRTASAAPKIITAAEYARVRAAGLDVVFNWEYDAHDLVNAGFDAAAAGREALNQLRAIEPDFRALYVSADFDVTPGQWPTIRDRLRTFGGVIGGPRVGLYAPYDALEWARRDGVASWFWQAGMSTAWSGGRNRNLWPGAHLRQRRTALIDGADCDISDIVQPDYGQHSGADMPLTPQDAQMVAAAILDARIPGTTTPDHPGDRAFADGQHDWMQLRAILFGQLPISTYPADSPLARLLAAVGQAAPSAPTDAQVNAAVLAALKDPTVLAGIGAAVAGHIHVD